MIFNPLLLIRTSIASTNYTILVKLTTNYVSCITLPNIISLFIFPVLINIRYKHAVNAPLKQDKETLVVLKRTSSVVAQMTGTSDEKDHYEITINKTRVKIDGSVSDQIQRAVLLMARFADADIDGIWGHVSAERSHQSQGKFTEEAETYLRHICNLHATNKKQLPPPARLFA